MTRSEAQRIAAALILLDTFPASMCDHAAEPCARCDSHRSTVEIVRHAFWATTRLEAAERAVVGAAMVMVDTWALWAKGEAGDNTLAGAQMKETVARLRDLRATIGREAS